MAYNDSRQQVFYNALAMAKEKLKKGEEIAKVKQIVGEMVDKRRWCRLEYFELAESKSLNLLKRIEGIETVILCIAGYVGEVRLIDNMFLN